MKRNQLYAYVAAALLSAGAMVTTSTNAQAQSAQTTAFTYQGQLVGSGGPINNSSPGRTFRFTLLDGSNNPVSGIGVTNPVTATAAVVDGLFTANVDFGLVFGSTQYNLQIEVLDGSTYEMLGQQPINTVPVAQYALSSGNNLGPTGPQGPAGPQGDTGSSGPAGQDGAQGAQGDIGPQGTAGTQGGEGPQGAQGPQGSQGVIGPQGTAGTQGGEGPQGVQGPSGPQGAQGLDGVPGVPGMPGMPGTPGMDGPPGANGTDGVQGPQGVAGPQGPAGATGTISGSVTISAPTTGSAVSTCSAGGSCSVTVTCATGLTVIGGGMKSITGSAGDLHMTQSYPNTVAQSWTVTAQNINYFGGSSNKIQGYAICAQ